MDIKPGFIMTAAHKIKTAARADPKVTPRIQRVAETNLLTTMRPLHLSGKEWDVMSFLIERDGAYASNQEAMAGSLGMNVRTLSRVQRRLAQRGLIDLRYDGKRTAYRIRPKGVQMALKSASGKGYATIGASIESIGKDRKNESDESSISAKAGSGTLPPGQARRKMPLDRVSPGRGAGASSGVLPGQRVGAHPAFMRGHAPRSGWRANPSLTMGQRMVHLWQDLTGRLATPRDKGLLKAIAGRVQEPEALLAWAVRHWNDVGDGVMDGHDGYPAAPSLRWLKKYLGVYRRAFYMEPGDLAFLASAQAREGRKAWRKDHRESDWRDDESWRDGPHARDIRRLLARGRFEEARALIKASNEAWRTGPHADEIGVLLARGRYEEAEAMMKKAAAEAKAAQTKGEDTP